MPKYVNHDIITKLIEDTDWYHINSNGELVLGATSDTALYKASDILTIIRDVSTTDVAPIVHVKWIHKNGEMYCSICDNEALMDEVYYESPYCPDCGARMDGGNK